MTDALPPSEGQPEYLDQGSGGPLRGQVHSPDRRPRRPALVTGGVLVGLGLVGGGVWAVTSFLGTGAQPAEALPASTLAYASIDLDPSGAQKIEAMKTLRKFPAFRDKVGLDTGDDIREWVFDEGLGSSCEGVDYATDVEPWLGDRFATAAVDTGSDEPNPVLVLQVTDEAAADTGLTSLRACIDAGDGSPVEWVIEGDWAVVAETAEVARATVDAAAEGALADDADYQHWTDEVGGPGVMSFYAAPAASRFLVENYGDFGNPSSAPAGKPTVLQDFGGAAGTVRFSGGAVELEAAGDPGTRLFGADRGSDVLATLPAETAAAIGIGFSEGWFTSFVERVAAPMDGATPDDLMRRLADESGLDLPGDVETLTGESLALSIGSGFDLEGLFSSEGPGSLPIAVKVKGDSAGIERVLDELRAELGRFGGPELPFLDSSTGGEMVAIGPDPDYRATVVGDGGLGESERFRDVVREADRASLIGFVNFDADAWLTDLIGAEPDARANLAPLVAFGASLWQQDDTAHAVLRVTTD